MDIVIKSFNRPYYLDRCLLSIQKFVDNNSGKIIVLDDGTPEKYLERIQEKYPDIQIKKSPFYHEKITFSEKGVHPNEYKIPIDFWLKEIQTVSEYFILLEDDIWFTEKVNFEKIEEEIRSRNVVFTKLFWIGNTIINQNKGEEKLQSITLIKPKLYTILPWLYYFIFYKFDRFKIRKTLKLLKINTLERHLAYYSIYAVAGMIFKKEYFLNLWKNHQGKVDEGLQLYNAVNYFYQNKSSIAFARTHQEVLKTGFISSATHEHKEEFLGSIDMFLFNKILNEAWYNNEFSPTENLQKDISNDLVISVISKEKSIDDENWLQWTTNFKNYYRSIGCTIDD